MNESEYKEAIPHVCTRDFQGHMDMLLCWSMTSGRVQKAQSRGGEGPSFCHECDLSVRAKRWDRIWWKKVKKDWETNDVV